MKRINKLAPVVVLCLSGSLVLSACSSRGTESVELEQELLRKEMQTEELKNEISRLEEKTQELTSEQEKREQEQKAEMEELRRSMEQLEKKNSDLEKRFEDYRSKYKVSIRSRVIGESLDEIQLPSGRVMTDAEVVYAADDGIRIKYSMGTARISAEDMPSDLADRLAYSAFHTTNYPDEIVEASSSGAADAEDADWLPQSLDDVAKCSLFVQVTGGVGRHIDSGEGHDWNGTGFLCNVDKTTYIYTNAHNFDGVGEVRIWNEDGLKFQKLDFAGIEIAAEPHGYWKETGWGGDVVRIRLRRYYNKALRLDPKRYSSASLKDTEIGITGNTKGRGKITRLTGKVTSVEDVQIALHNVATQGGNSGSPMVRLDTFEVIGILTWGMYDDENPLMKVWSKESEDERAGINSGALLADFEFVPTSFDKLRGQREVLNQLKRMVRLLGLLDEIYPTPQGILTRPDARVAGSSFTVLDILRESDGNPVVQRLLAMDKKLAAEANRGVKMSNRDIVKIYINGFSRCLRDLQKQRKMLSNTDSAHFYFKCGLKRSRVMEICEAYEKQLLRTLKWYSQMQGTSAEAIPVGRRVRLPPVSKGMAALGLDEDE